jgi:hypothetical protein
MTGEIFVFLSLGALAAFMVWEGWRRRRDSKKPLRRSTMEHGFTPGASSRETAAFVAASAAAVFGFVLVAEPPYPPFHGRGALFGFFLFKWFGVWGMPMLCWVFALFAFFGALSIRSARLRGKPKN